MADPLRIRIGMLLLDADMTVKELAAALGVPPTRLYYHVRILEEQGLIEVAQRRMVSGIEERRYRAIPDAWTVSPNITTSTVEASGVVGALLNAVRAELELLLQDGREEPIGEPESAITAISMTEVRLRPEEVVAFQERIHKTFEDYSPDREVEDARLYRVLFVSYEAPGGLRAP